MTLFVKLFTSIEKLTGIQGSWNLFVRRYSNNPFDLFDFIKNFLELERLKGWSPFIFVGYDEDDIVGIAPLVMRDFLGVRVVKFALKPYHTPDFIIKDEFRKEFLETLIDLLFQIFKCKVADFAFPIESKNLYIIKKISEDKGISLSYEQSVGRFIVPLSQGITWCQFKEKLGNSYIKKFKRIEKRLDKAGSWQVTCFESKEDDSNPFEAILAIDKSSWKEEWRTKKRIRSDPELPIIWKTAGLLSRNLSQFKRMVCFLEINNSPVAFAIVLIYKQVGFITKTSFNKDFRVYSPGLVVWNNAVRTLIESKIVNTIDFETDLPFMMIWKPVLLRRIRVLITKGTLPTKIISLYKCQAVRRTLQRIVGTLPIKITGS